MTDRARRGLGAGLPFEPDWAGALFAVVAVIAAGIVWLSLDWPLQHDGPLLHYVAWAMDRFGALPYRDLFETSMPGTFAYHWLIGRLLGWGDAGFKLADAAVMAVMAVGTWSLMAPFGRRPAAGAAMLFTISYLWLGPDMTLQRDYVGLVLVVCGIAVAMRGEVPRRGRLAAAGLLFGLAALIKPHLAIGLGPLAWMLMRRRRRHRADLPWPAAALAVLPPLAAAGAVPVTIALAVLALSGALPAFLELLFDYLPLHLGMNGEHQPIEGAERLSHLVMSTLHMRGLWIGIPAAVAGFFLVQQSSTPDSERRDRLLLLTGLALVYLVYPSFAGQFFFYHWAPFQYFVVTLAALVLCPAPAGARDTQRWGLGFLAVAIAVTLAKPNIMMVSQLTGEGVPAPKNGAVDRMEAALRAHLKPGDRVQPLDWTGGAIHAMLRTEARLATRFLYDYHFYHHIDQPFTAVLRARFMGELTAAAPRLVLDVRAKPHPSGRNTTGRFPELESYLKANYRTVADDPAFRLLARR